MIEHRPDAAVLRCPWAGTDPLMVAYHDDEWGVPCHDDRELFERLLLEGFQAGLSWSTILRKRETLWTQSSLGDDALDRPAGFGFGSGEGQRGWDRRDGP